MAARVANALERGVHFRRSIFWSLRRIMDSGALGCEIILKGPIRSARARFEKVSEGYIPKAGEPSKRWLRHATIHVKQKRGILGVTVNIIPPDAKFPDKISLKDLPEIEYPEEEVYMPEGVEPDVVEAPIAEEVVQSPEQTEAVVESKTEEVVVVEETIPVQEEPEIKPVEKVEEEVKTEEAKHDEEKKEEN
jgi:small subunit ribosomal protein S3